MTDQQRGAYTPQQDMPLQFDPRGPASRRPLPMALIASGTLLLVLIAAVAMFYARGVRGDNEPPRPVGEPVATLKSAPAATAQPADSSSELDVAAPQNVPAKATPSFAAPPEQPQARAIAAAPHRLTVQPITAAEMQKSAPTSVQKPLTTVVTPPPVSAPLAQPAALALAKAPAAAPPPGLATPAITPAPSAGGAAAQVQIGAFSSSALADRGWSDVALLMPSSIGGKGKHVEAVDKGGQTLYRTSVTGFADRASAAAFCDALKAKGKICFVKS